MEEAKKDFCKKKNKSKLAAIISAVLLALLIAATVVLGILMPSGERIAAADGSNVTSIAAGIDNDWYYATSNSSVYHMDKEGNPIGEPFSLKDEAKARFGEDFDVGNIQSFTVGKESGYVWIYTNVHYLFKLENTKDGLQLCDDYALINGDFKGLTEDESHVYVVTGIPYIVISKYDVEDISTAAGTGYLYNVTRANPCILELVRGLQVQGFEVYDGFLYLFFKGGFYRMSTDFNGNDYEGVLMGAYQTEYAKNYDAFYAEIYAEEELRVENGEIEYVDEDMVALRAKRKVENLAFENVQAIYPELENYNWDEGVVEVELSAFLAGRYRVYNINVINSESVAVDKEQGNVYTFAKDGIFKYSFDDLAEIENEYFEEDDLVRLDIELVALPTNVFFDSTTGKGYTTYQDLQTVTFIDFRTEKEIFTGDLDYDISVVIHNTEGDYAYYLYEDKVNGESGVRYLKGWNVDEILRAETLRPIFIVFIILSVISAIETLISFLFWKKKGFDVAFFRMLKDFKKQWIVYTMLVVSSVFLIMFCYYPAVASISNSFFDYTRERPTLIWNNFKNYVEVFTNEYAGESFKNMFVFLFFDLVFALIPPLVFAFFLTIMRNRGYSALTRTLLFIPGIIPGIASTLLWKNGILGGDGVLSALVQLCGGEKISFFSRYPIPSLIFMGFPYVGSYLIFYGAMMNVPDSYYEAAELDGITVMKRFLFIDIPLIFSQIKYVFILTFIGSVQNFGRTELVTGGQNGDKTVIFQMYTKMNDGAWGEAAAYATILFLFLFVATVLNLRMQTKDKEV